MRGDRQRGRARGGERRTDWIAAYPELAEQWHPTRNEGVRPSDVSYGSGRKVWWKCPLGSDHEWEASPNNRTSGRSGCPFCAGRRASITNSLAAHPELVRQWHPSRNGDLSPDQVVAGSTHVVWWQCQVSPEHEWEVAPHDRVEGKGVCPFCLGMRVAERASLAASVPTLAAEWHPSKNGSLTPRDVLPTTTRVVWWRCPRNPAHEWRTSVLKRSAGANCPACARDPAERANVESPRAYVLCVDSDGTRRLALLFLLRSHGIDALGARDAVEASRQVAAHGSPRAIVTGESSTPGAGAIAGVPRRVVPLQVLRAALVAGDRNADWLRPLLHELERLVRGDHRG